MNNFDEGELFKWIERTVSTRNFSSEVVAQKVKERLAWLERIRVAAENYRAFDNSMTKVIMDPTVHDEEYKDKVSREAEHAFDALVAALDTDPSPPTGALLDDIDDGETGHLDWLQPHVFIDSGDVLCITFTPKGGNRRRTVTCYVPFAALQCFKTCYGDDNRFGIEQIEFEAGYRWLVGPDKKGDGPA